MKLQGTLLNTADYNVKKAGGSTRHNGLAVETLGDLHVATSKDTPLRVDAFALTDAQKIDLIEERFRDILDILGMDLSDDSLKGTPRRVAKMYVQEIFKGLNPKNRPDITLFENKFGYGHMLLERDITLKSYCEHHLVPIIGKAHVAYISNGNVIGLSKINRLVDHFARRPQVQERLTEQIAEALKEVLQTDDVAVVVDADHFCVSTRGVQDQTSSTVTSHFSGQFNDPQVRSEFYQQLAGKRY
jgi:GTP cyclohydrolase I